MINFNYKKKILYLFLFLFLFLLPTQAQAKKVAVIGSSTFRRGCDISYGFIKILEKELPSYTFNCSFPKSKMECDYFKKQFEDHVSNQGYDELLLYGGLNGIWSQKKLDACKSDISAILGQAQKEGMRVVVVGAQAFKGSETYRKYVKEHNKWLESKPFGMAAYINLYSAVDKNNDDLIDDGLGDSKGLHLISDGNKILADLLLQQGYGVGGHEIQIVKNTNADSENGFVLINPDTKVTIPGLDFTPIEMIKQYSGIDEDGQYLIFPYIGEYLSAIYRYGIVAGGLLAIIIIIFAGLQWTVSAGNDEIIKKAQSRISSAVVGLLLLVISYFILYTINPNLVVFKNLKVLYIPTTSMERSVIINLGTAKYKNQLVSGGKKLENTEFDKIFKSFANCNGVDWRILKGIAYKESKFNTTIVNHFGYTGLFQTVPENCRGILRKYPNWAAQCENLTNPHINTAVGVKLLSIGLPKLKKCPNLSLRDALALLYLNHNSGPGSLDWMIDEWGVCKKGGTDKEVLVKQAIIDFWNQHKNGRFKGKGKGEIRGPYAYATADVILSLGTTNIYDTSDNGSTACPLNGNPPTK